VVVEDVVVLGTVVVDVVVELGAVVDVVLGTVVVGTVVVGTVVAVVTTRAQVDSARDTKWAEQMAAEALPATEQRAAIA
jgi:hypothetical protein